MHPSGGTGAVSTVIIAAAAAAAAAVSVQDAFKLAVFGSVEGPAQPVKKAAAEWRKAPDSTAQVREWCPGWAHYSCTWWLVNSEWTGSQWVPMV